jgi:hypothetical protein
MAMEARMVQIDRQNASQYLRVTWLLSAERALTLPDSSSVRFFGQEETKSLAEEVRRRNVFARYSRENNFYLQRIGEMADCTVIEVLRDGEPDRVMEESRLAADLIERLVLLSVSLATTRGKLQARLGIGARARTEVDFVVGPGVRYLRSTSRRVPRLRGIAVNDACCNRFAKCGFPDLYRLLQMPTDLARRVDVSTAWLLESRREPALEASVVKTAIALESLLVFSESESLARPLSERGAFILSSCPDTRREISRAVKRFYNARSGVVHGSKRKLRDLQSELLEAVDRLVTMLCLTIGANQHLWPNVQAVGDWCEMQRWGTPDANVVRPYAHTYLRNALNLARKA